ncbi:hypothetical protein [Acidiplasma aeolicum]|nr:hypothetical protein [Acidiplasma aeolicum]
MRLFVNLKFKDVLISVGIGIIFMLGALLIQLIIDQIPEIIILVDHHYNISYLIKNIKTIEIKNAIIYSIYLGMAAGFIQEGFTYFAISIKPEKMAFFIGIGFSAVDIAVIFIEDFNNLSGFLLILIILNIISSLLFHPGTATFMKFGKLSGHGIMTYITSSILHTSIDGSLVYTDIYILTHIKQYIISTELFWAFTMVISISIFLIGILKLNSLIRD